LSYKELDTNEGAFILATTTPVQFEPDAWQESLTRILDYQPQNMYLTHYGRVTEVDRLASELREEISQYADVAKQFINTENQKDKIKQGILETLTLRLQKRYPKELVATHLDLLNSDIELNASGLEVWIKRQEKAS